MSKQQNGSESRNPRTEKNSKQLQGLIVDDCDFRPGKHLPSDASLKHDEYLFDETKKKFRV